MPSTRQAASSASANTLCTTLDDIMRDRKAGDCSTQGYAYCEEVPPLPRKAYNPNHKLRTAVFVGEPFAHAVDWQNYRNKHLRGERTAYERAPPVYQRMDHPTARVLVLNSANPKTPGGEWTGGVLGIGGEEALARRSTLAQTLQTFSNLPRDRSAYPLKHTRAVYSPDVVVIRDGPETGYRKWPESEWTCISMVSVAPLNRPKTDPEFTHYSFAEEERLQREKMKTILRIAALNGHVNLVLTPFGSGHKWEDRRHYQQMSVPSASNYSSVVSAGSACGNPTARVARIWYELLFEDDEFRGYFDDVVFVITAGEGEAHDWFREMAGNIYRQYFS